MHKLQLVVCLLLAVESSCTSVRSQIEDRGREELDLPFTKGRLLFPKQFPSESVVIGSKGLRLKTVLCLSSCLDV